MDYGNNYTDSIIWYMIFYFIFLIGMVSRIRRKQIELNEKNVTSIMIIILASSFISKLILAPVIEGFPNDIACFKSWAFTAAKGLGGFYDNVQFCDYPPGYIYILYIVGKLTKIFSISDNIILIKMPAIISDTLIAYLLFRHAKGKIHSNYSLLLVFSIAYNPAMLLNSTIWGMCDSFLTLFVLLALFAIIEKKLTLATALFVFSILVKPQGLFFAPVLFFELVKAKDIKIFIKCLGTALATAIIVLFPFAPSDNIFWVFSLYLKTASQYAYASLNAFNLYALLGANAVKDSYTFLGISFKSMGQIFDITIFFTAFYFYLKGKHKGLPLLIALFLHIGIYTLSVRMHERYLFTSICIAAAAIIYLKDKRIIYIYLVSTAAIFLNMHVVLKAMLQTGNPYIDSENLVLIFVSLICVILFIYISKITFDTCILNRIKDTKLGPNHTKDKKLIT